MGDDPYEIAIRVLTSPNPYIVVSTLGCFTMNMKAYYAIVGAAQLSGKTIFVTSPFPGGGTDHDYMPAKKIKESGAHVVHILPKALKVKIKLAHQLYGDDIDSVVKFVTMNNYVGEQPPGLWMPKNEKGGNVKPWGNPEDFEFLYEEESKGKSSESAVVLEVQSDDQMIQEKTENQARKSGRFSHWMEKVRGYFSG